MIMTKEICAELAHTLLQNEGFNTDERPGSRLLELIATEIRDAFNTGVEEAVRLKATEEYTSREMRLIGERDAALLRAEEALARAAMTDRVVLAQIIAERERQDAQWGGAEHDDSHERRDWLSFIVEHVDRAKKAIPQRGAHDLDEHRKQLVEIAALAVAAIEAHDREVQT